MKTFKEVYVKAKRVNYSTQPSPLKTPENVIAMSRTLLDDRDIEVFFAIPVDSKNKPLAITEVARGSVDTCPVSTSCAFRTAVVLGAASLFVVHNHPSGDPQPSREDYTLTKRMHRAGSILGIPLLDHIVLGEDDKYWSMAEKGEIPYTADELF